MVHSLRRTFQKAQAMGRDVGVMAIPVIRAQYSKPSLRTRYLTLGSFRTLLFSGAGTNRIMSTWGGRIVAVSHPVKHKRLQSKKRSPPQRSSCVRQNELCKVDINASANNVQTSDPTANGWSVRSSRWCIATPATAKTHSPRAV